MYKSFFGLRNNPFSVNPDPRFLCMTAHAKEALACLTYGIHGRKGFVVLTGEVGTGKTTLLNKLQEWLRRHHIRSAFIFNPRLEVDQFLAYMMTDFGIPGSENATKSQLLTRLNNWLLDRARAGETAVLIVDEAQNLAPEMLEEIRLLTNLETSTEKLLQIVLSGQPELDEKLRQPQLRQLRQRVTLRSRTYPLTAVETADYVNQRMQVAGATEPVFLPAAIELVHLHANGIPRVINLICEHSLITAFAEQQRKITPEIVQAVAEDLELIPGTGPEASAGGSIEQPRTDLLAALNAVEKLSRRLREVEAAGSKKGAPTQ